jgi:hypothetical protein
MVGRAATQKYEDECEMKGGRLKKWTHDRSSDLQTRRVSAHRRKTDHTLLDAESVQFPQYAPNTHFTRLDTGLALTVVYVTGKNYVRCEESDLWILTEGTVSYFYSRKN